jgi:hypothetical protein
LELRNEARATLQYWISKEYTSDKVRKLIGKIGMVSSTGSLLSFILA